MNRLITILLLVFISFGFASAQKLQYFDDQDRIVIKKKAIYYREIFPDSVIDGAILVKKYKVGLGLIESGYYKDKYFRIAHGKVIEYYDSGKIKYITNYLNNLYVGEAISFYENGAIKRREVMSNGELIISNCYLPDGSDTTYYPRFIDPTFKGEDRYTVRPYIQEMVDYPLEAVINNIQGTVELYFCIDENNEICDIKITSDTDRMLNDAAIVALKKTAKYWVAGYEEGKKSKSQPIFIPIIFALK